MKKDELKMQDRYNSGEKWRPLYHFTAPRGWINDPNGLIFYKGRYHLFYQYNPKSCDWGAPSWGHAVSDDMIHWEDLPVALTPDKPYEAHPEGGCFSGCAVEKDGTLYIFYTAVAKSDGKIVQTQCLVTSADGIHFEKHPANPLIREAPEGVKGDFRDPKVFAVGSKWYMVVGASIGEADHGGDGRIFLYESEDLLSWTYRGAILKSEGKMGTMFECPDLFEINGKWVLTCSPMNHPDYNKALYCVGDMDFEKGEFHIEKTGNLDYGSDFYAPQSFVDKHGNRVIIAWQNGWLWMPWCENWGPTGMEGWRGVLSVPKKLTLLQDLSLSVYPVEEMNVLLKPEQKETDFLVDKTRHYFDLTDSRSCYLKFRINGSRVAARNLEIGLFGEEERCVLITLDLIGGIVVLDTRHSASYNGRVINCPFDSASGQIELEIFVDRSCVELYLEHGKYCITTNVYPDEKQNKIWICTPYKTAVIDELEIGTINNMWENSPAVEISEKTI